MRLTSTFKSVSLLLASIALISACSTPVKLEEPKPVVVVEKSEPKVEPKVDTTVVKTVEADPYDLNNPKGLLAKRSVYFDYDSYIVKDEFKSVLENHSKYLVKNPARKILIQGNTDERGGREYNLALGQKRADAVRQSLSLLGVSDTQVESVSFGKEKPAAQGADESAFAKNRRAEFFYR